MMLWKNRGERPAREVGGRRRHSIIDVPRPHPKHPTEQHSETSPAANVSSLGSVPVIGTLPFDQEQQSKTSPLGSKEWLQRQDGADSASVAVVAQMPQQPGTDGLELPTAAQNSTQVGADLPKRFSLLKFRNASDPQLSTTYATAAPPPPPTIITTSPTVQTFEKAQPRKQKRNIFKRSNTANSSILGKDRRKSPLKETTLSPPVPNFDGSNAEERDRLSVLRGTGGPPAYGDESSTSLAIPVSRLSESSRSDGSGMDNGVYAQTTTTHTVSTTTTFFRLPRRKKDKGPLFPLPAKVSVQESGRNSMAQTPRDSASGRTSMSPGRRPQTSATTRPRGHSYEQPSPFPSASHSSLALTNAPFGAPGTSVFRKESSMSTRSGQSTPSLQVPPNIGSRGRSSTLGSLGKSTAHDFRDSPPQMTPSGRNSTSTSGRKSFGDIFSLSHRLRQNSEPPPRNGSGVPGTPVSTGSKPPSFQIPREMPYPERAEEDTPATYLAKLEATVPRGMMAAILCKGYDEFSKTCLRKYMRGFSYFVDPIDMAVRKMLMEVELPKETQQIDRLLQGFADRYCECNPGIFASVDEAYFVAFSILLLHSDTHNKNNKRKMQKHDYVKNIQDQVEVSHDILDCFYDNVSYTPFIHFEDEVAVNSHRLAVPRARKGLFRSPSSESLRGPVDPYNLILDGKLDVLRPSLKEVMDTDDTYNSMGTAPALDVASLHHGFFRSGILQIVSARSRPDAFATQATISNPAEAQAGLVDIKAAKVGLLWRKDPKKKKTKSPWQEWGAILTSSQLYFFRDVSWIKKLISQHDAHQKQHHDAGPVMFKPPMSAFEPDALMSMDDAVALLDTSYKKHKNAFLFIKHGGFEEVFLANDDADMNDWISKLNYAATFRTAGVRMRGHIGPAYDGHTRPGTRDVSTNSARTSSMSTNGEHGQRFRDERELMAQVMAYRHQIMEQKIDQATEKLLVAQKELDTLLRNARHLQVLTPVQARSREGLVLAAGRMSAKLKWLRVEMWRTKCHRDILQLDIDQGATIVGDNLTNDRSSILSTPQKAAPGRGIRLSTSKSDSKTSDLGASPKSASLAQTPRIASQSMVDRIKSAEGVSHTLTTTLSKSSRHRSASSLEVPGSFGGGSVNSSEEAVHLATASPASHSLIHQASIISSHRRSSDPESRITSPTQDLDDGEEQILREAGLLSQDAVTSPGKRPDTSESDRDRVGAISPDIVSRERGSMRRSLQRTLRDSQHGHHLPHHHRSKKGRESGSSVVTAEDGSKSTNAETDGLARSTGSFIVHGKKASVITFGSEWQVTSNEDRLKLKKQAQSKDAKEEIAVEDKVEDRVDDETACEVSAPDAPVQHEAILNSTATAPIDSGARSKTANRVSQGDLGSVDSPTQDFFEAPALPEEWRRSPQPQAMQA